MATDFWLIEWQDISGDADHCIKEVAVSASAAVSALGRILEGEIVTDAATSRPLCPKSACATGRHVILAGASSWQIFHSAG
jgi:hypothetical protein